MRKLLRIKVGKRYTFRYDGVTHMYGELQRHSGQKVTVLHRLREDEVWTKDVGQMFKIQFDDGYMHHAFHNELWRR